MKKLFVALVVAALFAPLSFAEEGKKKDSFAGVGMPTNFAMGYAKATDPCPSNGDIAMSEEGLILSCQSGAWQKQSSLDSFNSYLFDKRALSLNCSGQSWNTYTQQGQQCRMHQHTTLLPAEKTITLSISAIATALVFTNQDANVFLYFDDVLCGNNRSIPSTGYTPSASASCSVVAAKGAHTVTFMITSVTDSITSKFLDIIGSLVYQ